MTIGSNALPVLDANGNWSIGVPASVISALAQGDNHYRHGHRLRRQQRHGLAHCHHGARRSGARH
ncbi:hypothetical protein ACLB1Q_13065 [Escherichia coli]